MIRSIIQHFQLHRVAKQEKYLINYAKNSHLVLIPQKSCTGETQDFTMIRRPLTEITLKLDDLQEYETYRREQANNTATGTEMQEDTPKSFIGIGGTKPIDEVHARIGYAPKKKPNSSSTV